MAFIVIEGLDGSGKSTQLKILLDYLEKEKKQFKYIHFPRTDSPVYGELIASFLRGELGKLDTVNPYLVALIYAGDRMDAASMIREWLQQDLLVVADRYVYSNIAFQCAKMEGEEEKRKLWDWIIHLEYEYYRIPRPDASIFLDVPFDFTRENLRVEREGSDRKYLDGQQDIHEENLDFQEKVRKAYHSIARRYDDIELVDCSDDEGRILPPEHIFEKLISHIERFIIR